MKADGFLRDKQSTMETGEGLGLPCTDEGTRKGGFLEEVGLEEKGGSG